MKCYQLLVDIEEGSDEFWEGLANETGCDTILEDVKSALDSQGIQASVKLVSYTDK